jgi:protein dithiol oxidoreductase (disulfide-forming)
MNYKTLIIFVVNFFCVSASYCAFANTENFKEGDDYEIIAPKQDRAAGLIEFFSYSCSYCYRAESVIKKIEQDGRIAVVRVPVHLGKDKFKVTSFAWFLSNELELGEGVHENLFDVVHAPLGPEFTYNKLLSMEDLEKYFTDLGVTKEEYSKALKRVERFRMVEKASDMGKEYAVKGTPAFIVNGKYKINGVYEGPIGKARLERLINYLYSIE